MLLGITEVLNQMGITPVWITSRMPGEQDAISNRYQTTARYNIQILRSLPGRLGEIARVLFNQAAARWCSQHQITWVINHSNTTRGFAKFDRVISYIQFPREARAASPLANIHDPSSRCVPYQLQYWRKRVDRWLFATGEINARHKILVNSHFTQDAWKTYCDLDGATGTPHVLYPFADDPQEPLQPAEPRQAVIATLGRFCAAKRQREQVSIARQLSEFDFWIMGHANPRDGYLERLKSMRLEHGATNVSLLSNLPFSSVRERLSRARYFLHTTIEEPFGITSVEAILAGCLPIVHDSGGQREVVPISGLRFHELADVPGIIRMLESDARKRAHWLERLRALALETFTASAFRRAFRNYLETRCAVSTR